MTARASASGKLLPWPPRPGRFATMAMVLVPLAALARALGWSEPIVFALAALAIIPLAGIMGRSTEHVAARLGAGIGGLLNATFGNAAELIIGFVALRKGLFDVVKASLTGSIIGNILLVLGLAILVGGLGRERQTFDRRAAAVGSTLLALAAIGFVVPAIFHIVGSSAIAHSRTTFDREFAAEHHLSLLIAVVLLASYGLHLLFSLRTHRHLYAGQPMAHEAAEDAVPAGRAAVTLAIATVAVAWMSELLVGAVEASAHALGVSDVFVGVIIVAIIGNAAEHSTAVLMAMKGNMDLAIHIAVGSSIQIALFVTPVLVFASYAVAGGPMNMVFTVGEVLAVGLAVATMCLVAQDGESNWLEGALLLAVYLVLGIAFFYLP